MNDPEILNPLQVARILMYDMSDEDAGELLRCFPEPAVGASDAEFKRWCERISEELMQFRMRKQGAGQG